MTCSDCYQSMVTLCYGYGPSMARELSLRRINGHERSQSRQINGPGELLLRQINAPGELLLWQINGRGELLTRRINGHERRQSRQINGPGELWSRLWQVILTYNNYGKWMVLTCYNHVTNGARCVLFLRSHWSWRVLIMSPTVPDAFFCFAVTGLDAL